MTTSAKVEGDLGPKDCSQSEDGELKVEGSDLGPKDCHQSGNSEQVPVG